MALLDLGRVWRASVGDTGRASQPLGDCPLRSPSYPPTRHQVFHTPEGSPAQLRPVDMSRGWKDQARRSANFGQVSTMPASEDILWNGAASEGRGDRPGEFQSSVVVV